MCLVPAESAPGDRAAGRGIAESRGVDGREAGGRAGAGAAERTQGGERAGAVEALRRRGRLPEATGEVRAAAPGPLACGG